MCVADGRLDWCVCVLFTDDDIGLCMLLTDDDIQTFVYSMCIADRG